MVRFIFFLTLLFFETPCLADTVKNTLESLEIKGHQQIESRTISTQKDIFRYMNGEAEAYFPFGFQALYVYQIQNRTTKSLILVERYDMSTSEGARGILDFFSRQGYSQMTGLGESALKLDYLVLFKRDNFFYRISPDYSATTGAEAEFEEIVNLAQKIDLLFAR